MSGDDGDGGGVHGPRLYSSNASLHAEDGGSGLNGPMWQSRYGGSSQINDGGGRAIGPAYISNSRRRQEDCSQVCAPAAALLLGVAGAGEVAIAARAISHCSLEVTVAPASVRGYSMMAFPAPWATSRH